MLAITSVWGALFSIILPNQVQLIAHAQWFTGADSLVDLQQLSQLQQNIHAGTATADADQSRLLGLLSGYDVAKAQGLAIISSIGALVTMLLQPIIGVLSDRTRSRMGRRAPWILYGSLVGAVFLVLSSFATTLALLAVLVVLAQAVLNMALNPLGATVADRVVERQRGAVSGLSGLANFLGGIIGAAGAGFAFAYVGLGLYYVIAVAVVVFCGLFVFVARDNSSLDLQTDRLKWRAVFASYAIALRSWNFRWVWVARVLIFFGFTVSGALGLYMMQSYITPALSAREASETVPLLQLAGLPLAVVAVLVSGWLSDRIHRRVVFVMIASGLMALSLLIPVFAPTLPGLFAQSIVAYAAFGIYLPVDQALFIDVLPDPEAAGRDLGVAGIATNLGQTLGPVAASLVVTITGGYVGIWLVSFVIVGLGIVAVLPLRNVR
ncbi:MFS transporter [Leifsonia aquatica]|uniref:MFS transporter n=1 Tax=Leifsonia aquatica TaxID=144185 RepID=UPI0013B43B0A|nr:MFS transporter [Leifsonia aquatica]